MPLLPHLALWAKLGTKIYPASYHPLLFHLLDVAVVARRLWEEVLRPPVKEPFAMALGLSLDDCAPWVAFWVGTHDIGKATPGFQQRDNAEVLIQLLRDRGFEFWVSNALPHAALSAP